MNPFAGEVFPDPGIALPAVSIPASAPKLHGVNFLIEIVGQRTITAVHAKALLSPAWQGPLGNAAVYIMSPSDTGWRRLEPQDNSHTYDSLMLAWPYLSDRGSLSSASAGRLLESAEGFAQQVGRRAMPLPPLEDIDAVARRLQGLQANLDAGVAIASFLPGGRFESDIWRLCLRLGLTFRSPGVFHWTAAGSEHPLLEVAPYDESMWLSLAGVQNNERYDAMIIGFRIPMSPDPPRALEGAFRIASAFEQEFGAKSLYEDAPLSELHKRELQQQVTLVAETMEAAGIRPGSAEAATLFG